MDGRPTTGRDRRPLWARAHLVAFGVWVLMWVVSVVLSGGQTRIVADTPGEYVQFGILFASCLALVASAVAARLEVGGTRATAGPLMAAAAMLGVFVLAAVRAARRQS